MQDLCARYRNRELALFRDFIAGVHQVFYEQIPKLRKGSGHVKPAKGSKPTKSA